MKADDPQSTVPLAVVVHHTALYPFVLVAVVFDGDPQYNAMRPSNVATRV
jgi:hypothetical protein